MEGYLTAKHKARSKVCKVKSIIQKELTDKLNRPEGRNKVFRIAKCMIKKNIEVVTE